MDHKILALGGDGIGPSFRFWTSFNLQNSRYFWNKHKN